MKQLRFTTIFDEKQAKEMWDLFSPKKTIDDDWNFRNTWREPYGFRLHFIVGYDGDTPVGLLPLQENTGKGLGPTLLHMDTPYIEFFAGIDSDDNDVWVLPGYEHYKQDFFKQIDSQAVLTSLKQHYTIDGVASEYYLDRFDVDLKEYKTVEDFLQANFDGTSRQRLINRTNKIKRTYNVEIKDADPKDLDILFRFSIDRFGERSSFNRPDRQEIFRLFLDRFDVDLFMITLDGEPKAMSYACIYNGSYITLNIGYDYAVRDISKFLVVTQLQRAIEKGCIRFDAGQGDNGWKSHFKLTKVPQYILKLHTTEAA